MSIGPTIYSYKSNFSCKRTSPKKRKSAKLRLFDLIRDGFITYNRHDMDYFVSIGQYFLKMGYPNPFRMGKHAEDSLQSFFMNCLFDANPFHAEDLYINKDKFDLYPWRQQFELFEETKITGLNYYANRSSMPLPDYNDSSLIYKSIFTNAYGKYNERINNLDFPFNDSHHDAIYILSKSILVLKDHLTYSIEYGCADDLEDFINRKSHSSWEIKITSEKDENYFDFCMRIYQNYKAIIAGSKDVLKSVNYQDFPRHFYLGGNFTLIPELKPYQI